MFRRQAGCCVLLIFLSLFSALPISKAAEPAYPTKPIEIMVGFPPGAATDVGARLIAEGSKQYLGQEVIVINKPGGTGKVAMTLISKAKPDGYTLGAASDPCITLEPHREETPYRPQDFTFIIQFAVLYNGFVVREDSPLRSVKDMIEFARANPQKLTIGTPGAQGASYFCPDALGFLEGVKFKIIPFSGAVPAVTSLLGGHIMAVSSSFSGFSPYLRAKKVRLLAVHSNERIDDFPEAPTLKELGYPSLVFESWIPITGPKNMDKSVVSKLTEAFRKAMDSPAFIKAAKELEFWVKNPSSGNALTEVIVQRHKQYGELLKKLGMGAR